MLTELQRADFFDALLALPPEMRAKLAEGDKPAAK
jgi:hypothetical protein